MHFLRGPTGRTCLFVICVKTIEEMFGDLKDNGFDVEATHLRDPQRLDRLMLAQLSYMSGLLHLASI